MARIDEDAVRARIQEARERAGLRQVDLAELLHVHIRTINNYEAQDGKSGKVPYDRLDDIAKFTDTTSCWLLYGDSEEDRLAERISRVERLVREGAKVLATTKRPPPGPERDAWDMLAELVEQELGGQAPRRDANGSHHQEPPPPESASAS